MIHIQVNIAHLILLYRQQYFNIQEYSFYCLILAPVDRLSVTLLMDNYTDRLLPLSYPAIRPPMIKNEVFLPPPMAEHGFSVLLKATYASSNQNSHSITDEKNTNILFDCGVSENGVIYNADILSVNYNSIDSIVLSHGHLDHFTALPQMLGRINKPIKLICHPDAFLKRWIIYPNGKDRARMPFLDKELLQKYGAIIETRKKPSLISKDIIVDFSYQGKDNNSLIQKESPKSPQLLITGQIPRHTTYEKGFPLQYKEEPDEYHLTPDPLVNDDQAIIVDIKEKGLIIISGCAHAGIINTINYAKQLTGINKIYAVVGGFHLTGGGIYDEAIEPTIREIKKIDPQYLVPCHCTGWKATNRIIQEMPIKFLPPSVCSTFVFE